MECVQQPLTYVKLFQDDFTQEMLMQDETSRKAELLASTENRRDFRHAGSTGKFHLLSYGSPPEQGRRFLTGAPVVLALIPLPGFMLHLPAGIPVVERLALRFLESEFGIEVTGRLQNIQGAQGDVGITLFGAEIHSCLQQPVSQPLSLHGRIHPEPAKLRLVLAPLDDSDVSHDGPVCLGNPHLAALRIVVELRHSP